MKKKVLFSIVGIALFGVAIALITKKGNNHDLIIKKQKAKAEGYPVLCTGPGSCDIPGAEEHDKKTYYVEEIK